MFVHRSNRAEKLVEALAELVERSPLPPTVRECVVVQGRGMERWLAMELAARHGVWANPDFPFPRGIVERAFASVLGAAAPPGRFEPETTMWSIAALLPGFLDRPAFAGLRHFLAGDEEGAQRVQLAARIASTFDQYAVYRPEMVLGWEAGAGDDWQAELWRALVGRLGSEHVAARAKRFLDAVENGGRPAEGFPRRVSVFGVSTLPPLYLRVLAALGRVVELHLFVLSPSAPYWADIRSKRDLIRRRRPGGGEALGEELHFDEGHPLLASLGRLGRDFQHILEEVADYQEGDRDLYVDPGTGSMLAALQSDILNLRARGEGRETAPLVLAADGSIAVHACHSPMREMEVLHDQLVAAFEEDPTLEPRHVVVMTPSIEAYAPFIEAVFGGGAGGRPEIPYRIADRSVRASEEVADAFLSILALLPGRLGAPEVLDLLGIEVVRARFAIAAEDLDRVRRWVAEAGIRWGVDGADRKRFGQPDFEENTWRFGLDRLLLGYAMAGGERTLFGGVLPYDDVEGTAAEILGRLADFCAALFRFRRLASEPRRLTEWQHVLGDLADAMLESGDRTADQQRRVRAALAALAERARTTGFSDRVGLDTVRSELERELERGASARGFLSGGVTFCATTPMQSIPFRVVCLAGLDDERFPRNRPPLGFDLTVERPARGDRSTRDDDRYLFLEAILAARERLLVSYVGQSIRDDGERPPSVVVSELLDTLAASFRPAAERAPEAEESPAGGAPAAWRFVLRHPLQPFSPRYFGADPDRRLFSYDAGYCRGAEGLRRARGNAPDFLPEPLDPEGEPAGTVTLDELTRFFAHPTRFLLQRRLGLSFGRDLEPLAEREPMELGSLERWQIGERLVGRVLAGEDPDAAYAALSAGGLLPLGMLGRTIYEGLAPVVRSIAEAARRHRVGDPRPAAEIDVEIDGVRVTGTVPNLWKNGPVEVTFGRVGDRAEIGLWIRHLFLAVSGAEGAESRLVGRAAKGEGCRVVCLRPVVEPGPILADLLRLYQSGRSSPLPFFARASRDYAQRHIDAGDADRALDAAHVSFRGNPHQDIRGEADDPYVSQAYGERDPLALEEFAAAALAVFRPLLQHRHEEAG